MDEQGDGVWFSDATNGWNRPLTITPDNLYAFYVGLDGNTYRKEIGSPLSQFSLVSSTPGNGATGIPTNGVFGLDFSKAVDQSTVPGNIVLGKSGVPVDTAAISYSGGIVTFHAVAPLDKNSRYSISVHSGLKSVDGDVFGTDWSSSFTTGDAPGIPNDSAIIWSTGLAPSCSTYGYVASHPECSVLNLVTVDSNNAVVYDGVSTAGSPVGDPVTLSTGEFSYSNALLHVRGDGPEFSLTVSYRSQAYANGPVGVNWDHGYHVYLRENADGSVTYFDGKSGAYTFEKDASGNFSEIKSLRATLAKADAGNYEIGFADKTSYAFDGNFRLSSIRDKEGKSLSFAYSEDGKLAFATDALGRTFSYAYGSGSRLESVTGPDGNSVSFAYYSNSDQGGGEGDLKSATMRNGGSERSVSFTYQKDATSETLSHNLLTLTDSNGNAYVTNAYDADDRVVSQKYGNGTLSYSYETVGGTGNDRNRITKTTVTNKRGFKSEFSYDEKGNAVAKKLYGTDGTLSHSYSYDSDGRVSSETKPLGNGTSYRYDEEGRLVEKRLKAKMDAADDDSSDVVAKYGYDTPFPTPTKITDPEGNVTAVVLDGKGNVIAISKLGVKRADGSAYDAVARFEYGTDGRLAKETDPEGNTVEFAYSGGLLAKTVK
ncbi:MAG: Ig-like domain-containing protein [Patescibacteria group bacterium]